MSSESVNFESLFERLQQLFDSKSKLNTDQIISCLDQQLKLIETISISDIPSIYLESFHTAFYKWLIRFQDDIQISEKLCQIFANLSRKDEFRKCMINRKLIEHFISNLKCDSVTLHTNIKVVHQSMRALGNLCYSNPTAQSLALDCDAVTFLDTIIRLLREPDQRSLVDSELLRVICGYTLNLIGLKRKELLSNPELINMICDLMIESDHDDSETFYTFSTLVGGLLCEDKDQNEDGTACDDEPLASVESFKVHVDPMKLIELIERIQGDPDDSVSCLIYSVRVSTISQLPKMDNSVDLHRLVDVLLRRFESGDLDDEAKHDVYRLFLALVTHTTTMQSLFQDGNGVLYLKALIWLQNYKSTEHQLYALLLLGCFAAVRSHSEAMVERGDHLAVIKVLETLNDVGFESGSNEKLHLSNPFEFRAQKGHKTELQRVTFSCLRNLSIPAGNSAKLWQVPQMSTLVLQFCCRADGSLADDLLEFVRVWLAGSTSEQVLTLIADHRLLAQFDRWSSNPYFPALAFQVQRLVATMLQVVGCVCRFPSQHWTQLLECVRKLLLSRLVSDRHRALKALLPTVACATRNIHDHLHWKPHCIVSWLMSALNEWASGDHLSETFDLLVVQLKCLMSCSRIASDLPHSEREQIAGSLEKAADQASHLIESSRDQLREMSRLFSHLTVE